jgi:molybdate transport system substrate-binding protein
MLDRSGLVLAPASLEPDVRAVLAKVVADEADAGIVYRSDIVAAGSTVDGIAIPDEQNVTTAYVIGSTVDGGDLAQEFIELALSPAGQEVLARSGFGPA